MSWHDPTERRLADLLSDPLGPEDLRSASEQNPAQHEKTVKTTRKIGKSPQNSADIVLFHVQL